MRIDHQADIMKHGTKGWQPGGSKS